jgi:hypothetical protein
LKVKIKVVGLHQQTTTIKKMKNSTYQIVRESIGSSKIQKKEFLSNTMTNDYALAAHMLFKFLAPNFVLQAPITLVDSDENFIIRHGDFCACDGNYYYSLELL